jgi:hypothetical protein
MIFGKKIAYHYEAIFSILSFLTKAHIENIYIYTDAPEFYNILGKRVTLCLIDEDQLREWEGKYKFFWRVKIKIIEDCSRRNQEKPFMYLDSDTFLYKNAEFLEQSLSERKAFMHKKENLLRRCNSKTERIMWRQVRNKTFGGTTITKNHAMWNAGVVALPKEKQQEAIELALNICDDMCAQQVRPRLIEQFALSVALDATYSLLPAEDFVGHYWGNKEEWDHAISNFFVNAHLQNNNLEEEIASLSTFNFFQFPVIRKSKQNFFIKI